MSLSLQIPNPNQLQRKKSVEESPTTAHNEATFPLPPKLDLSNVESQTKQKTLSPTTAFLSPSSSLLVPGSSNSTHSLSRRSSFSSDVGDIPADINQLLHTLSFFTGAPNTEVFLQEIASNLKIRPFKPGDTVIRYGDAAKSMFLIIKGELAVMSEDNEIQYATLSSGSFVGEIGVLFNTLRTANVVCRTKALLAALTIDVLQSKLAIYPDIKELLEKKGQERLQAIEEMKNGKPMEKENSLQRKASFRAGYNVARSSAKLNEQTEGGFLGLPDQMDYFKSRSSSRRSSINPESLFHDGNLNLTLHVPDTLSMPENRSRRNSSISDTSDLSNDDESSAQTSKAPSRRRSSIRFDTSFLLGQDLTIKIDDASDDNQIISLQVPIVTIKEDSNDLEIQATPNEQEQKVAKRTDSMKKVVNDEVTKVTGIIPTLERRTTAGKLNQQDALPKLERRISEKTKEDVITVASVTEALEQRLSLGIDSLDDASNASMKDLDIQPLDENLKEVNEAAIIYSHKEKEEVLPFVDIKKCAPEAPRRISIAVWTDHKLMQQMNKRQQPPVPISMPSVKWNAASIPSSPIDMLSSAIDEEPPSENEQLISLILKYADIQTLFKFRCCSSKMIEHIIKAKPIAISHMNLNPFFRKMTDKILTLISKLFGPCIQKLDLHACWQLTDRGIENMAKHCPDLMMLRLSEVWEVSDRAIKTISKQCQHLIHIDLANCRKISNSSITYLLENSSSLKSIGFSYCKTITDRAFDHDSWSKIEYLNFQRCTGITDRAFETWASFADSDDLWIQSRSLAASSEWKHFDKGTEPPDEDDRHHSFEDDELFSDAGSAQELTHELTSKDDLSNFVWEDIRSSKESNEFKKESLAAMDGSRAVSSDLKFKIESLEGLNSSPTDTMAIENLAQDADEEFQSNPSSNSKKQSQNNLSTIPTFSIQAESFGETPSQKTSAFHLRSLNLRDCSFLTDSAIAAIASVCGHLRILNLGFCCSLTDEFARHLVKGCSRLSKLDVSFCGAAITDRTLLHLSTGLSRLTAISIRGCIQVTEVGIDHLIENGSRLKTVNLTQCKNIPLELHDKLREFWVLLDTESVCDWDTVE